MADEITLSALARTNLTALQQTATSVAARQRALATGKRVNQALDGPVAYFSSTSLVAKASDLASARDQVNQGVSAINAAVAGAAGIDKLLDRIKGVAVSALANSDPTARGEAAAQINALRQQIDLLAADTSYNGVNLLSANGSTLSVPYQGSGTAGLTVAPQDLGSTGLGVAAAATNGTGITDANEAVAANALNTLIAEVDSAKAQVASVQASLGSNISILTARAEYNEDLSSVALEGAATISTADVNQEAVGLIALQTRQQLATTAHAISQRGEGSVLALF
ncbi:flagellin [Magnetospirillum sp. UT-4]|uniref:flagellin n=1 Tax=Magnetospirillum sp. UT-4 TaxID=2681467 RepID=UPI0013852DEE|nr:hypothetical protein [Magnetospirillum sp. UT-4]CAA7627138.1 putative Flagellin [Magnetospirillum sp. UT-4]